jgi:hypothetical protein
MAEEHVAHLRRWRNQLVKIRREVVVDALRVERIPSQATKELLRLQDMIAAVDEAIRDEGGEKRDSVYEARGLTGYDGDRSF